MKFVSVGTAALALMFSLCTFAACGSDDNHLSPLVDAGAPEAAADAPASCGAAQLTCNGTCVTPASDPQNCGSCGAACRSGDLCCASKCVQSGSCGFAVTKVDPSRGFQNGGEWVKLEGQGFTPDMTVSLGDGRAPVRVIDATHALIQTPPGMIGTVDLTITTAQGSAVTRTAFTYQTGPLAPPWKNVAMGSLRGEHPAITPLQDGRVLIAGGTTVPDNANLALDTALVFSREGANGAVAPTKGAMGVKRWRCSATTMLDGRALVVGSVGCGTTACKSGDLFDPTTDTFKQTAMPMSEDRSFTWSVLMVDGRVMITSAASATAEIYDPAADTFTTVPLVTKHQFGQRVVRLRDGRVLVIGGDGGQKDVEAFDPATGKFTAVAPMQQGRSQFTAHVLPDGRVMVFGGSSISAGGVHVPMDAIEAWDPKSNTWTVMPYKLSTGRTWHASALVRDGTVIVMGGYNKDGSCDATNTVDVVDPTKGTVAPFDTLQHPNTEWNAVTMLDGSVVGVGGGECGQTQAYPDVYFLPGGPTPN